MFVEDKPEAATPGEQKEEPKQPKVLMSPEADINEAENAEEEEATVEVSKSPDCFDTCVICLLYVQYVMNVEKITSIILLLMFCCNWCVSYIELLHTKLILYYDL